MSIDLHVSVAEAKARIETAAKAFPAEFRLTSLPGTFRIDLQASYVNDVGTVQLYLYKQTENGWLACTKCTPGELRRFIKS